MGRDSTPLDEVAQAGKKEGSGNHTPVSLTSIIGKALEQLILETISQHLEDKKIIMSIHHGFTNGKSCLISLITFYDEVAGLVDESGHCNLDFGKALGKKQKRPWPCGSPAQQLYIINPEFSTNPKHGPTPATLKKINSTLTKTSTLSIG